LIAFPALAAVFLLFLFGMEVRFDRAHPMTSGPVCGVLMHRRIFFEQNFEVSVSISGAQGGIAQKMISIVAYIARCNNSA
jgi:hypothetical protein